MPREPVQSPGAGFAEDDGRAGPITGVGFGGGNSRCGIFFRPGGDGMAVAAAGCFLWMGMRPVLQAWPGIPRSLAACVACAALAAAGCTMCPDPYDYSGPVPNGSAPQNDFRARSHGILPIGAAPKPFPPVVKAAPQPASDAAPVVVQPAVEQPVAEQPVAEQPVAEQPLMAEADADVLRLAAEVPVVPEVDADDTVAAEAGAPATEAGAEVAAVPDAEPQAVQEAAARPEAASAAAESGAEPQPARVAAEPPLRETPGWRTRR